MKKKAKVDKEILSILDDYHLFLDDEKSIDMPFYINQIDMNHSTSLKGETELNALHPLGKTKLQCKMRNKSIYNYSFSVLSDCISTKMLFRLDEGDGVHWNRHFNVPLEQQQVPTPHFHKKGNDGIEYAYRTEKLEKCLTPLNIHEGFEILCEELHINKDKRAEISIMEAGVSLLEFEQEKDPLNGISFP